MDGAVPGHATEALGQFVFLRCGCVIRARPWAEGTLWVGQYRDRKIYQIDPQTGAILRTIESNRFVTGVTWIDGKLWHGTCGDLDSVRSTRGER